MNKETISSSYDNSNIESLSYNHQSREYGPSEVVKTSYTNQTTNSNKGDEKSTNEVPAIEDVIEQIKPHPDLLEILVDHMTDEEFEQHADVLLDVPTEYSKTRRNPEDE